MPLLLKAVKRSRLCQLNEHLMEMRRMLLDFYTEYHQFFIQDKGFSFDAAMSYGQIRRIGPDSFAHWPYKKVTVKARQ